MEPYTEMSPHLLTIAILYLVTIFRLDSKESFHEFDALKINADLHKEAKPSITEVEIQAVKAFVQEKKEILQLG